MHPGRAQHIALVLSGGGARAAYQVGVLRAIADLLPSDYPNPFDIICGTSAGGLNAAGLATHACCLQDGVSMLESVWGEFRTHQVYRTDVAGVLARAWRFITTMVFGRMRRDLPVSLLDNSPLRDLLQQRLTMSNVQDGIDSGHLRALCITASGYSSGESVSFFQGVSSLDTWRRSRRIGVNTEISIDHLMASAAIPIFFPAVRVNREFFGDGALRQLSPMSPALHLGAERVLVIGVGGQSHRQVREKTVAYPSIAQVVSHIMNSSFVDSLEADVERLTRINRTLSLIPDEVRTAQTSLRQVEVLVMSPPAEVLDAIAMRHARLLPPIIRLFVQGSGATHRSGSGVLSYLLFEAAYCQDLMELGYHDGHGRREEIRRFLGLHEAPPTQEDGTNTNVVEFKRAEASNN
ncbi:MAG TPA: patatin-like phospholipase family protein [Moraxellaceae bacterium]|nr:patatin-like phospholipase family protein [Moraxellaceae bacterium]